MEINRWLEFSSNGLKSYGDAFVSQMSNQSAGSRLKIQKNPAYEMKLLNFS